MDEQASFEPQAVLAPRRAGWNRLAVVVPVVALVGAVWIGTSGPHREASTPDQRDPMAVVKASSAVDADARTPALAPPVPIYPTTVLGLPVRSLADVDSSATADDQVVAIAGWYLAHPVLGCPRSTAVELPGVAELGVDTDLRTFCDRSGVLVATLSPAGSMNIGGANDHPYGSGAASALPVSVTPGAVLPDYLLDPGATLSRVVMVGRLLTSEHEMVVDRVVWAAGLGQAQTTSILPKLLDQGPRLSWRTRDRVADVTVGPTGAILLETLVDPTALAAVDPAAAASVAATSPASERIWYRLALAIDPAREAPRWLAIDDATGRAIASGSIDRSAGT